jgi:type VI secretion system protein VasI
MSGCIAGLMSKKINRLASIRTSLVLAILSAITMACDPVENVPEKPVLRWQHIQNTNPADGSKTVQMMIGAGNQSGGRNDPVALVLSCESGITDAYIIWRQYLGVYDPEITWRVGSDEETVETWSLSTDNEATFAPHAIALIKRMMINERFLVKTAPVDSSPITVEFNTAGLQTEITDLRQACGW